MGSNFNANKAAAAAAAGGKIVDDLWSQIMSHPPEEEDEEEEEQHKNIPQMVFYQRRPRPQQQQQQQQQQCYHHPETIIPPPHSLHHSNQSHSNDENWINFVAAPKRVSWNRSLSTRGRVSIAVETRVDIQPQKKQVKRRGKPPIPKGKAVQPPNFEKERQYFEQVDAFELLEESPSPKNFNTWATGNQTDNTTIPHLSSKLEKWLTSKQFNDSCGPSSTLSKILESPAILLEPTCTDDSNVVDLRTPEKPVSRVNLAMHSVQSRISSYLLSKGVSEMDPNFTKRGSVLATLHDGGCEEIEAAVKKLSLASTTASIGHNNVDPFSTLLAVCGQSVPSTMLDVFSKYCDPQTIIKVGEGTYGEAFKAGNTVCKIVPIDGDLQVNGEVQKRSEELVEEVILSRTLNHLRRHDGDAHNACTTFIETLDLQVCQGPYDNALITAWESWDEKHGSENDHPKGFPEKQCYVVFVLQHGGKDLESFVLLNFDEAKSLLVQVTAALAVAEAAYEFEHRDLHWGNILLSRNESTMVPFSLEGKQLLVRTFGLVISIIDFTLSRINTGEDILFLDLSSDPYLFKGPKGDRQAETYRKMKEITEDVWEGSFPKTNVLWLLYLVDILLLKKSFERSSNNMRDLRALKKRLDKYNTAKEAIFDPFFSDLFVAPREGE